MFFLKSRHFLLYQVKMIVCLIRLLRFWKVIRLFQQNNSNFYLEFFQQLDNLLLQENALLLWVLFSVVLNNHYNDKKETSNFCWLKYLICFLLIR